MNKVSMTRNEIENIEHVSTLGELILHLENESRRKGEVVCEVRVNNLFLTEEDEVRLAPSSISEINSIEIHTSTVNELIVGAKTTATHYIKKLKEASLTLSQNYRSGNLEEALQLNHAVISGIEWVLTIVAQIKGLAVNTEDLPNWLDQEARFLEIANEVVAAFQQDDHVLLSDILEYDWCNSLDNWSNLLAQLKLKESTDQNAATNLPENNSMV